MADFIVINLAKDYTCLSGQQGSNLGGFFRHKVSGKEYYIKWLPETLEDQYKDGKKPSALRFKDRNRNRFQNEYLALKLYELFGIAVPKAQLITFTDEHGRIYYGLATEKHSNILPLSTVLDDPLNSKKDIKQKIQEDFLIDVLLSNYDVIGLYKDNLHWDIATNTPLRLDTGAALSYRAQGAPKKNQFSESSYEFEEMESGTNSKTGFNQSVLHQSSAIFKGVHESLSLIKGLRKLLSISDEAILDCIHQYGFSRNNLKDRTKNQKIGALLVERKKKLIEKAEEKIFDQLIREFYYSPCSEEDKSYTTYENNNKNPIYRVKHGGMHASRVALYTESFIALLQEKGFAPAINLTEKDRFLIKVAAMFHDAGRKIDAGNDKKEWELEGAHKCRKWLEDAGFEREDIDKVCQAIAHKDNEEIQNTNIIALILAASDSLDWVRSHSSDFNPKFLPPKINEVLLKSQIIDLAMKAKRLALEQGDSPRAQLNQEGLFSITTKRLYEQCQQGCYSSTKIIFAELQIPEQIIGERIERLNKALRYFKNEAYQQYKDDKIHSNIKNFIKKAKLLNENIASHIKDDKRYQENLEAQLSKLAIDSFPHRNNLIRLVLDIILFPLCFIRKAIRGTWFFSTAQTNRAKLFQNELIDADTAIQQKNWARLEQLIDRGEILSKPNADALKKIKENELWGLGFRLERACNQSEYQPQQGPLNKTHYTLQLEALAHRLLMFDNFEIINSQDSTLLKFDDHYEFNLTKIFKYANLSHLNLSTAEFYNFENTYLTSSEKEWLLKMQPQFPSLSLAEMSAIRAYTGIAYYDINHILRGTYVYQPSKEAYIRHILLQTIMCGSGLSKTPDRHITTCYRGEALYDKDVHFQRIQAAASKGVINFAGFVSSSINPNQAFDYEVKFTINNLVGKYIAPLSLLPYEQEFLIMPTQIQLEDYQYTTKSFLYDGEHFFRGSMVTDLTNLIQSEEMDSFAP